MKSGKKKQKGGISSKIIFFWKDLAVISFALVSFSIVFSFILSLAEGSIGSEIIVKDVLFTSTILVIFMGILLVGVYEALLDLGIIRRDSILLFISVFLYAALHMLFLGQITSSVVQVLPPYLDTTLRIFLGGLEFGILMWGMEKAKNSLSRGTKKHSGKNP